MTQLAQAYIHLKPYSASKADVQSLGRFAKRLAIKAAAEIYGGDVEIEVQIEEGSLITRITVVGMLFVGGAYSHIADYKGFKESVVELCGDAKEFAVDVCSPFINKAGVPAEEVYRFERRLKTPGKLYRLSKRLDKLEHSVNELSPRDVQKELANIRAQLESVTRDLSAAEQSQIEIGLRRPKLPPPEKWPISEPAKVAVQRDREEEADLFEDDSPDSAIERRRRTLFKERASVPRRKRRGKKRIVSDRDLLS